MLSIFKAVPLRTRRALLLYKVYGDSALLVLNGTSLNSDSTFLALNWRYVIESSLLAFKTMLMPFERHKLWHPVIQTMSEGYKFFSNIRFNIRSITFSSFTQVANFLSDIVLSGLQQKLKKRKESKYFRKSDIRMAIHPAFCQFWKYDFVCVCVCVSNNGTFYSITIRMHLYSFWPTIENSPKVMTVPVKSLSLQLGPNIIGAKFCLWLQYRFDREVVFIFCSQILSQCVGFAERST